jgi:hypothetical protein
VLAWRLKGVERGAWRMLGICTCVLFDTSQFVICDKRVSEIN